MSTSLNEALILAELSKHHPRLVKQWFAPLLGAFHKVFTLGELKKIFIRDNGEFNLRLHPNTGEVPVIIRWENGEFEAKMVEYNQHFRFINEIPPWTSREIANKRVDLIEHILKQTVVSESRLLGLEFTTASQYNSLPRVFDELLGKDDRALGIRDTLVLAQLKDRGWPPGLVSRFIAPLLDVLRYDTNFYGKSMEVKIIEISDWEESQFFTYHGGADFFLNLDRTWHDFDEADEDIEIWISPRDQILHVYWKSHMGPQESHQSVHMTFDPRDTGLEPADQEDIRNRLIDALREGIARRFAPWTHESPMKGIFSSAWD